MKHHTNGCFRRKEKAIALDTADRLQIRDALLQLASCDVADALDVLGRGEQTALGIRALWDDCPRLAGRALTLKLGPDYQGSTVIGTLEAIESAGPGDVLVIDNRGLLDRNSFGSVSAFCAARAGIAGAVIDGVTRDLDDLKAQAFPVYARGVTTTSVRGRTGYAGHGVAIECSGVAVTGDDFILADGSGVIVIPGALIEQVLETAPRFQLFEREMRRRIVNGKRPIDVHKQLRYEDFEARARAAPE
jgi:regulator of RNase E activity RraA